MKNGSKQPYNVPLIPIDLRQEECILQIADSLDYLDRVANDVFVRIQKRVDENTGQLKAINDRVHLAQTKIDSLKGTKKATKVFSSAKYPGAEKTKTYESVFPSLVSEESTLRVVARQNHTIHSKHEEFDPATLKQKLQFCNVHVNLKRKADKNDESQAEGLGRLPKQINSVSALLLFNTSENPYKKYVMLDPLGVVTKTRSALQEEPTGLADAPSSIRLGEQLQRQQAENYFYVPDIGQVPEIAVPDFLPDLIGVADDLSYTADQGPSIAPSVFGSNMPDLPAIVPEPNEPGSTASSANRPPPPPPSATPPPPPPPGPPPPPPPPGPPPPVAPPPPPPPPPPPGPPPPTPATPPAPASTPSDASVPLPGAVQSPGNDIANLLEAIRRAGGKDGARLKKVERKKEKAKIEVKATSGGGDLMADLFNKLTLRRKGISGSKKENEQKNSSSDSGPMAPPPRPKAESGHSGQDEEDWE